jgi:gliding motility-associated-like protein
MKRTLHAFFTLLILNNSIAQVYTERWNSPVGWQVFDGDGDGNSWASLSQAAVAGSPFESFGNTMYSQSIDETSGTTLNPNNFIASPQINLSSLNGSSFLLFDVGMLAFSAAASENFEVFIGTTAPSLMTIAGYSLVHSGLINTPSAVSTIPINISQYNGQSIYIVFRHFNTNSQSLLFLDNIFIYNSNFSMSTTSGCIDSPITFTNTSVGNSSNVNVSFDFSASGSPSSSSANTQDVSYSDVGFYTITQFVNGIPMESKVIQIVDVPTPNFTYDVSVGCSPLRVTFTTTEGPNGMTFSFPDGTSINGQVVSKVFNQAGSFDVTLTQTISDQCFGSNTLTGIINVLQSPNAQFTTTDNNLNMDYPIVTFINTTTGGANYEWDFGDTSINSNDLSPTHLYPEGIKGSYEVKLIATSADGCIDSTVNRIVVEEKLLFFVPNTFTPNGDEYNNSFKPIMASGVDPKSYNLSIFNRWGQLIFESNDFNIGWDGDYGAGKGVLETQTYTYKIRFGTLKNDEVRVLVGNVTLLK